MGITKQSTTELTPKNTTSNTGWLHNSFPVKFEKRWHEVCRRLREIAHEPNPNNRTRLLQDVQRSGEYKSITLERLTEAAEFYENRVARERTDGHCRRECTAVRRHAVTASVLGAHTARRPVVDRRAGAYSLA